MTDRPDYCCGRCPEITRGGYDCTCRGNPRCEKNKKVRMRYYPRLYRSLFSSWNLPYKDRSGHWWAHLGVITFTTTPK